MRYWVDALLAIPCALLPKRYWQSFDLPMANMAPLSSWVTMIGGFVIGVPAYFAFLDRLRGIKGVSIYDISTAQVEGRLPETAQVSAIPSVMYMTAPVQFLFTPLGFLAAYMVLTGLFRVVASFVDEAQGDPILTGADRLGRKLFSSQRERSQRVAREKLEKTDEPDRRYDGAWAGLTGVDFVIVAARRKPGWSKGTWVITPDGWYVLGEPFDRPMPNGLRTIYPLTAQNTLEAVRKSVTYELPPLRPTKTLK
ncbi:MAG TPA: hypothetical protein VFZ31_06485 [Vicinamibacterales bacterium]